MKVKLKALLVVHAVFNLLGAVLLIFADSLLNKLVHTSAHADFLWRLLGVSSLALAYLSYAATNFKEKRAVSTAIKTLLIFNGLAFIVSLWAIANGLPEYVLINGLVHLIFFVLFVMNLWQAKLS